MDTWIWALIAAFVVLDTAVVMLVLRAARRKRAKQAEGGTDDLAEDIGLHT